MPPDPRKVIGGRVQAKAVHVTNLSECARPYGANRHTKMVLGTVVEVEVLPTSATSTRTSTFITADYELGEVIKQARLNLRSVKVAPAEGAAADPAAAAAAGLPPESEISPPPIPPLEREFLTPRAFHSPLPGDTSPTNDPCAVETVEALLLIKNTNGSLQSNVQLPK